MNDDIWNLITDLRTGNSLSGYADKVWIEKIAKEENSMPYYNRYGYSNTSSRDGEVAKAALEALEKGITLDDLLAKNKTVKAWWSQLISERMSEAIRAEKEKERRRRADERKRLEEEARQVALSKLTPEEIAAFGLTKKGYPK